MIIFIHIVLNIHWYFKGISFVIARPVKSPFRPCGVCRLNIVRLSVVTRLICVLISDYGCLLSNCGSGLLCCCGVCVVCIQSRSLLWIQKFINCIAKCKIYAHCHTNSNKYFLHIFVLFLVGLRLLSYVHYTTRRYKIQYY